MKKFVTAFSIIIICYFASYYNVNAMSTTIPQSDIPNIFDIGMALGTGIELDISQFNDIDEFMDSYKEKRFDNAFLNALDVFYDLISDDAFNDNRFYSVCFPNEFQMNMDTYNNLSLSYQDYLLHGTPLLVTYNDDIIARWSNYDRFYVNQYLLDLNGYNIDPIPETSTVNVPVFDWPSCSYTAKVGVTYTISYGLSTISGLKYPAVLQRVGASDGFVCGADLTASTASVYGNTSGFGGNINSFRALYPDVAIIPNAFTYTNGYVNLTDVAFAYLTTGKISSTHDIATAPDVIRSPDNEIIGQDCYLPDIPGDGFFDLTKFWDLLIDAINDPAKDVITWNDVVDNGIIVDDSGTALDDSQIKTKDISEVIEDSTTKDPDIPEDDSETYKNILPPLPPLIRFPDIRPGGPHPEDAFNGISVLARIINVTNKSLPEGIMYVFWGIIFGMITLGLIKILHK